jgi:hypothetical protein
VPAREMNPEDKALRLVGWVPDGHHRVIAVAGAPVRQRLARAFTAK